MELDLSSSKNLNLNTPVNEKTSTYKSSLNPNSVLGGMKDQEESKKILHLRRLFPYEIIHPDEEKFETPELNLFLKLIVALMIIAPGYLMWVYLRILNDFLISQIIYQIILLVIMAIYHFVIKKVDYPVIMVRDTRFVHDQMIVGIIFAIVFGLLAPITFVIVCEVGVFKVPENLGLFLPLLDLNYDIPSYIAQGFYLIMYFLEYVVLLPFVEQFYYYVFIQGQLGSSNMIVKIICGLGHLATFILPIITIYESHIEGTYFTIILVVVVVEGLIISLYYNGNGYVASSLIQSSFNLGCYILVCILYFSNYLNNETNMSMIINNVNYFDCIIRYYRFEENSGYRCP